MSKPLTKYLVFEWLLDDSQDGIKERAEETGGTLVEVVKAGDIDAAMAENKNRIEELEECNVQLSKAHALLEEASINRANEIVILEQQLAQVMQERDACQRSGREKMEIVDEMQTRALKAEQQLDSTETAYTMIWDKLTDAEERARSLQKQLATMTAERDNYIKRIQEEEPIFKSMIQQLTQMTYRLNVLEPELTACRARADYADQQLANVTAKLERTQLLSDSFEAQVINRENWIAKARRDLNMFEVRMEAWLEEVDDLKRQLVRVTAEVQHYREACASVGETDGHGWAETTKNLQQQLVASDAEIAQRKGWQKCKTHGEINADHAWGCPDCVREMRHELSQWRACGLTEELLRKQDGFLKLNTGCLIVRQDEYEAMRAELDRLKGLR